MPACPSRLTLSLWEARSQTERPAELASHVQACSRCASIVEDLAGARSALFGADPEMVSARVARSIVASVERRKQRRRWLNLLVPALLLPATAALLLSARPALRGAWLGGEAASVKGGLILETYCKRGDKVLPAENGGDFWAGDRLRFAYSLERSGFLLVFGVDDQGRVFPYYQDNLLLGQPVQAGAHVLLPGSVELDGHRGWERVFALWSEKLLADDAVRAAVASAMSAARGDLRRVTTLDLPADQVSLLLRRP